MDLPGWQDLRQEIHHLGVEIVTVGLEIGGADVLRPFIETARPQHPSLVDQSHRMDALFGVTNIPSAIWIDEDGVIVRPHESAVPPPAERPGPDGTPTMMGMALLGKVAGVDDHQRYANRLRDWAAKGGDSEYALTAEEVVARSRPMSADVSAGAAHFELAQQLWRQEGFSQRTLRHFADAHTLQPDNITYKRQAYSAWRVAHTDEPDDRTRFMQSPADGEDWPFVSDFTADMKELQAQRERDRAARER
jgi:hypothetical protein